MVGNENKVPNAPAKSPEEPEITRRGFGRRVGLGIFGLGIFGLGLSVAGARLVLDDLRTGDPTLLRPPGALPEDDFLAACIRCGHCIEVCPPEALFMVSLSDGLSVGTPAWDWQGKTCDLCQAEEILHCIDVCPTTALSPVSDPRKIDMGEAVIDRERCFAWNGAICRTCWHVCPFPGEAIVFDPSLRVMIDEEKCVGCALCVEACITDPTSISITPRKGR